MRNFKVVLFVLGCLCGIHVQAQQLEIKGVVTSSDDKQTLIGVVIPCTWRHRINSWLFPMSG